MADISGVINTFRNAVYGEDVRSALISLATTCNTVISSLENDAMLFKGRLDVVYSSSVDVNTVTTSGSYYVGTPNNYSNLPVNAAGILYVENVNKNNIYYQRFNLLANSVSYCRYKVGSNNWSTWTSTEKILQDSVTVLENDAMLFKGTLSTIYSTDVDVNTVTTSGSYYVGTPNNYSNLPVNAAGILYVENVNKNNIYHQNFRLLTNTVSYSRLKVGSGSWSSWISSTKAITDNEPFRFRLEKIIQSEITSKYSDLAGNLYPNTMSWIGSNWFEDLPNLSSGSWIFTIGAVNAGAPSAPAGYACQFTFTPTNGEVYYRMRDPTSGWINDWVKKESPFDTTTAINNAMIAEIESIDNLTDEGYYYSGTPRNTLDGLPYELANLPFILLVRKISSSVTWQQIFNLANGYSYARYKVGSNNWVAWRSNDGKNTNAVYYAFGDSTTYGQIGGSGGQSGNAYPFVVGKRLKMIVKNKAVGGQGLCKDWSTIQSDYITDLDMSDANLITVGWAYNDGDTWRTLNRGDYTSTTDTTVIGRYYMILKQFQQKCPTARVILITGYGAPTAINAQATLRNQFVGEYHFLDQDCTVGEFYDELEKMCKLHGFSCINQHNGTCFNEFNATTWIGDSVHPTHAGYLFYGQYISGKIASLYSNVL